MLEISAEPPPSDGVTRVRFSAKGERLLVSSWSGVIGLYDDTELHLRTSIDVKAPVLDAAFDQSGRVCSADLRGSVSAHTVNEDGSVSSQLLGKHSEAARCLEIAKGDGIIVTGGWDEHLCGWRPDATGESDSRKALLFKEKLPGRVFAMSQFGDHRLLVATSSRQILLYDTRKPSEPEMMRESPMKNQLRCVVGLPSESGFAAASTEGRVAIEKFDGVGSFTFKCHRVESRIYPVNAIAFHPRWHTFATGGGDGNVSVWDGTAKKRICQYPRYDTSISSLDFHPDGHLLSIAVSYTFEEGDKDHPPDRVFVRPVIDADVQPRARKS